MHDIENTIKINDNNIAIDNNITINDDYISSFYNIWQEDQGKSYIINTLTRAIVEIKPEEKFYVKEILNNSKNIRQDQKYRDYCNILISQGFLVNKKYNEKQILAYCYHQLHFSDKILKMTILPTMRCNFRCPYCFETEKGIHWEDESLALLKHFAEKTFPEKKLIHLAFFGGEPLLEWKRICEFLEYCLTLQDKNKLELHTSLTTNGYLLNEEKAYALIDKYHCMGFQITIDGCKRTHDRTRCLPGGISTYERVMANFKSLLKIKKTRQEKNLQINLRVNLLNNTIEEVKEFLNSFSDDEKKLFTIYFRPVYSTGQFCLANENSINLETFYNLLDEMHFKRTITNKINYSYCEGDSGINTIQIMPDLTIWKCMNDTGCEEAKIGHITADGELNLEIEKIEKWSRNDPFTNPVCKDCAYLPLCFGGCPLHYLKTTKKNCFYEKNFNLVKHFIN